MFYPSNITAGKTYEVLFGEHTKRVYISGRTGHGPDNYTWNGTIVTSGERIRIASAARFFKQVLTEQFGPPWFISCDIVGPSFVNGKLEMLLLSIREQESHRLVGDLPDIPPEALSSCAEAIRNAIRFCRSGPSGSDADKLHLFDDENKIPLEVSIDLSFDLWDPAFAGVKYVEALFQKIETAYQLFDDGQKKRTNDDLL